MNADNRNAPAQPPAAIEQLPVDARPGLLALSEKLTADLEDNLHSLTVVGSVLTADYRPGKSDINTLLIVGRRSHKLLKQLSGYGTSLSRYRLRAPLVMTEEYIARSLDVFPIEFLDFQLNHLTLLGADPLAGVEFRPEDVRAQCERELKVALMTLRQGYISAAGQNKLVGELLLASLGQMLPTLRAVLYLHGHSRQPTALDTFELAARHLGIATETMAELWQLRRSGRKMAAGSIDPMFESLYQAVDELSRQVDSHGEVT